MVSSLRFAYTTRLILRLLIFAGIASVSAILFATTTLYATATVVGLLAAVQMVALVSLIERGQQQLQHFIASVASRDFSQQFSVHSGDKAVAGQLNIVMERLRESQADAEKQARYLSAIVTHVPVPIIAVDHQQRVSLFNPAARRLFLAAKPLRLEHLPATGEILAAELSSIAVGERKLLELRLDTRDLRLNVAVSEIKQVGIAERIYVIENIEGELEQTELKAWRDLIRVLTHEINNSVTPITSLARTAAELTGDLTPAPQQMETLEDVQEALATIASRGQGLMDFVNAYRQLLKVPKPKLEQINVYNLIKRCHSLVEDTFRQAAVQFEFTVEPLPLEISADGALIEQVFINLLQNAAAAVREAAEPQVRVEAQLIRGGQVKVAVMDNGTGVPEGLEGQIFVPFFTTKREGSGVGLSLCRQIMRAHGGRILYRRSEVTEFILLF